MSDKYLFSQGNASFEKGDFSRAISFYSSAIDLNPGNFNYYKSRCIAYLKNKEFNQAIADANTIANRNTGLDYGYLLLGISYLASSQLEKAEDYLVSALQRNPENPITKSYLDIISQNRQTRSIPLQDFDGNFQELIPQFQENPTIINNFAGNPAVLNALSNYLDTFDRPTNVRYAFNKYDVIRFQNKEFLTKLLNEAKSLFKANQFENAIELCQKGIMSCNENTESEMVTSLFQIVTSSYIKIGEIEKAVIFTQEFSEFARKSGLEINDSILKNCEYIQIAFQNYNEVRQKNCAISHYEQSKRSDEMPVFFNKEISNSVKDNKIELATQIANEAVAVFPNDPTLRYTRAKANFMIERYDDAIADCLKAVEIKPDFSKAHFLIAKCYMKKNEPKKARFFVRRTLFYDKENVSAAEMISQIKDMIHMQKEEKMRRQMQQQQQEIGAAGDNVVYAADGEKNGEIKMDNQKESVIDGQIPQPSVPPNFQQNVPNQEFHEGVIQYEQNFEQQNFNQDELSPQNFEPNQMQQPHSQPHRFNRFHEILQQQQQDFNQTNQKSDPYPNARNTLRPNIQTAQYHNHHQQQFQFHQTYNQQQQQNFQFRQQNFANNNQSNQNDNGNLQHPHSQPPSHHSPFAGFRFPTQNSGPPHNNNNLNNFQFRFNPQNH